jgi:selenide,water dikinase
VSEAVRLTALSKGSGCGCKINPTVLKEMLDGFRVDESFPGILVGNSLSDDCSVYDLGDDMYLLQTVDFFTPIVDDPYVFGAAAAANALSDIWAMGGKPVMANAVFGWPLDKLPVGMGRQVLQGAFELCKSVGVAMAGGHSIDSQEAIFGLSVTGTCKAHQLKRNSTAEAGDVLLLTKPLGVGMLAAAHKRGQSSAAQDAALYKVLQQTNKVGEIFGGLPYVHAMTDVTGFGLAGHLLELCKGSGLRAVLQFDALPLVAEAQALAAQFVLPDNAMRNWNAYEKEITLGRNEAFPWLVDPQTNGGLLVSVAADKVAELQQYCAEGVAIGVLELGNPGIVVQ